MQGLSPSAFTKSSSSIYSVTDTVVPALTEFKVWENKYSRNMILLATFLASENFRRILPRLMAGQITHKTEDKISLTGKLEGEKLSLKMVSLRQNEHCSGAGSSGLK